MNIQGTTNLKYADFYSKIDDKTVNLDRNQEEG